MPRPILATISVPAMQHNLQRVASNLQSQASQAGRASPRIWAVIKANAYGHGLAQGLAGFSQADGLAMLDLAEAVACRQAGWKGPLMLLEGFFEPEDIHIVDTQRLTVSVHGEDQLRMLEQASPAHPIKVNLKINGDRKSTRLNSSHVRISYAVFCLKKKKHNSVQPPIR